MTQKIGTLLSGSLMDGFSVRIAHTVPTETVRAGKFVSIVGNTYRFFSLITDIRLEVANPDINLFPPEQKDSLFAAMLYQRDVFATAKIKPMLMLDQRGIFGPVKTVPPHFSEVVDVSEEDVRRIFGSENDPKGTYFCIGTPLDMQVPVCLDLARFVERSSGIFGKTGTGKTFITRLVLAGVVKTGTAVTVVFDMHSEYGVQARQEGQNASFVKGLKTLFPDKVAICSIDPEATRRRGASPDMTIRIPYSAITVPDILSLQSELNLHPTALEAAYLIAGRYKQDWLAMLLAKGHDAKELAQEVGAHAESIAALYRKLKRIEQLPFFVAERAGTGVVDNMIEYLDRGISLIVEFGNYTSSFVYLLIANILTRRIHSRYIAKTEQFLGTQDKSMEPRQLLIVIEEAHKFLNPTAASQTIFGVIAREMRKYYVALLVVDQRPSGIDPEVLSQIGTKLIAQLNDEKDIQSVVTGTSNASGMRAILASLDSKKQVLVLGHAVTMPVVIQTREYDETFYKTLLGDEKKKLQQIVDEIF